MTSLLDYTERQAFSALIFDCDGTLANTTPVHYRTFSEAFAEHGHTMARDWYFARTGLSRDQVFEQFAQEFGLSFDNETVANRMRELFFDYIDQVEEIAQVTEVARRYHGVVPMAVASGGQRAIVEATLTSLGLLDLFDTIVAVENAARSKPAPDLFLEAARRLGVDPTACLVFEDSDEGLEAAKRAGMASKDVRHLLSSAA